MRMPDTGFTVLVTRLRNDKRAVANGYRYRTVGRYACYLDGERIDRPDLRGASVEPRGPGDNGPSGIRQARRIEAGTYPLGTHGFTGSEYHTFDYHRDRLPRPGLFVHETGSRSAILIHTGAGFKSSAGCINLTHSIAGPDEDIGPDISFDRLHALIAFMKDAITEFPSRPWRTVPGARLVIENEP